MPNDIKKAAIALVLSCLCTLIAVYFDGQVFEEIGYGDPVTLGMNFVWTLIIAWLVWEIFKGKDIKLTLLIVAAIMLGSIVWDVSQFGFGIAQAFYVVELSMFGVAYLFLNSEESRNWYTSESL
uniref:hypothetical protein n=1 Tax=Microbulbifer agarilyticus TaxID=260552 RepID=UPI0002558E2F|nr:hypothetical protein [Microbulbifer agarilyticus]